MEQDFSHFDEAGRARMVSVGGKEITRRAATAAATPATPPPQTTTRPLWVLLEEVFVVFIDR